MWLGNLFPSDGRSGPVPTLGVLTPPLPEILLLCFLRAGFGLGLGRAWRNGVVGVGGRFSLLFFPGGSVGRVGEVGGRRRSVLS